MFLHPNGREHGKAHHSCALSLFYRQKTLPALVFPSGFIKAALFLYAESQVFCEIPLRFLEETFGVIWHKELKFLTSNSSLSNRRDLQWYAVDGADEFSHKNAIMNGIRIRNSLILGTVGLTREESPTYELLSISLSIFIFDIAMHFRMQTGDKRRIQGGSRNGECFKRGEKRNRA